MTELKNSCNPTFVRCEARLTFTTENDPSTYLVNIEGEIIKPGLNNLVVCHENGESAPEISRLITCSNRAT